MCLQRGEKRQSSAELGALPCGEGEAIGGMQQGREAVIVHRISTFS